MNITSELFGSYLKCRYKASLKACGVAGQPSEYEQMSGQRLKQYAEQAPLHVFQAYKSEEDVAQSLMVTGPVLREGYPVIVNARITADGIEAACDALERVRGASSLGDFHYLPVLFRVARRLSREDRLMLGFAVGGHRLGA